MEVKIGETINMLTLMAWGVPKKSGGSFRKTVIVKCTCGNVKKKMYKEICRTNGLKSCGCLKVPKPKKTYKKKEKVFKEGNSSVLRYKAPVTSSKEIWKENPNDNNYLVSSKGNLFSFKLKKFIGSKAILRHLKLTERGRLSFMYKLFVKEYDTSLYDIIPIDNNWRNLSPNNMFKAHITNTGKNWVIKSLTNMYLNDRKSKKDLNRTGTVTVKHLIDLYKEQEGLSYFLKLKMDMTMTDPLSSLSIDRIDNNIGYQDGNIKLVTRFENMGRRETTFDKFENFCNDRFDM